MPVQMVGGGVKVPTVVVIGGAGDRTGRTAFQNGTTVTLKAPGGKSGYILIAPGGNGDATKSGWGRPSHGGDAGRPTARVYVLA